MGRYSISDLEKLSGIKAHTIRIWEQRYALLHPLRTDTNIRYYDDQELRKLLNISTLIKTGTRISEISKLSESELYQKLDKVGTSGNNLENQYDYFINQLITSGLTYNEAQFEKIFSTCLLRYGMEELYIRIIYPFLDKIGLMWGKEQVNAAQEHFLSNLLKQKLFTAIDSLPPTGAEAETCILFLPEGEYHEIGLLFTNYLLRLHKKRVIYLGQSVPFENLKETIESCQPKYAMCFFVRAAPNTEIEKFIKTSSSNFNSLSWLISGNSGILSKIKLPKNVTWVKTIKELKETMSIQ